MLVAFFASFAVLVLVCAYRIGVEHGVRLSLEELRRGREAALRDEID